MSRRSLVPALRAVVLAVIVTMVPVAGFGSDAGASPEGSGELEHGRLTVGVAVAEGGSDPVPIEAGSGSLPRLVHYVATPLEAIGAGNLENLCQARGQAPTPAQVVFGRLYDVVGYARDGSVVSESRACYPLPDPAAAPSVPPVPPAGLPEAPTIGEIWRSVALPPPIVGANPVSRGVTGLETRIWSGGPQTAQVAVTLGGFTVIGVAQLVGYRFATDEGYLGSFAGPGDAQHPAASHEFATKGAHSLSASSLWRATATMTGPDFTVPVPIELDLAVLGATVDYPVTEVRSVLVG